jgi:protein-export membrane protein SecD
MQVDMKAALTKKAESFTGDLRSLMRDKNIRHAGITREGNDVAIRFRDRGMLEQARALLAEQLPDLQWTEVADGSDAKLTGSLKADAASRVQEQAIQQNITTLHNRVNELGVAEPVIQKQGADRIVVDLAGIQDEAAVRSLIGSTARLEFRMVVPAAVASNMVERLDRELVAQGAGADSADVRPFSSKFAVFYNPQYGVPTGAFVRDADVPAVNALLAQAKSSGIQLPEGEPLWELEPRTIAETTGRTLQFVNRTVELSGDLVANAERRFDLDYERPNAPGVSMTFSNRGATRFAQVTKANVGNHLAIVLDGVVRSAPVIREAIRGGRASITGSFSDQEALVLATVLRAGALPVNVKIAEERTVGPSLGRDSVHSSLVAGMWAALATTVFMIFWYRGSGVLAVVAMVLQIFLLLAGLAALRGTLTVPGIAGIILTIGMAVDANVLIYERIREEIRNHKTVRAAIDAGYSRAFITIFDSNLTTLIAALVLFQYGTGPIKGFAVTLSIGIVANMLTAVLFTRMVFDLITSRRRLETLSI